jgi:ABC-type polysaccharide/polyol phosphate transport system ATPase subunit
LGAPLDSDLLSLELSFVTARAIIILSIQVIKLRNEQIHDKKSRILNQIIEFSNYNPFLDIDVNYLTWGMN